MNKTILTTALCIALLFGCKKEPNQQNCTLGFTGGNCDEEIKPSKIEVLSLKTIKIPPLTANGSAWDFGSKPDIYFVLSELDSKEVLFRSKVTSDHNVNTAIELEVLKFINNPTLRHVITMYDSDTVNDEFMGAVEFTPYTKGQKFPTSKNIDCTDCKIGVNFSFKYLY